MPDKTAVEPMDASLQNSPVSGPTEGETTVTLDSASNTCFWNGKEFKEGALVESEGTTYECTFGRWVKAG